MNIKIDKKDDIILKILHYFITEEDYKPIIINGVDGEIWLENMQSDLKLIRINSNYIHNEEQLKNDTLKAKAIMKRKKKSTLSFKMNMLNLLMDTGESVKLIDNKNIETIKVEKITDVKLIKESEPDDYRVLYYKKDDHIIVDIPEISVHCYFEEGFNMDCVYPDYNF